MSCEDDYEYRHYSSIRAKICKRFIFVNSEGVARGFPVNVAQFEENGKIPLCKILQYLEKRGLDIENYTFYIPFFEVEIDGLHSCYVRIEDLAEKQLTLIMRERNKHFEDYTLPFDRQEQQSAHDMVQESSEKPQIPVPIQPEKSQEPQIFYQSKPEAQELIHQNQHNVRSYHHLENKQQPDNSHNSSTPERDKKHRRMKEPERVVGDVILAVKKWRLLHDINRMSLADAAKVVGISKKSLDDYFLVLRIGEFCGFDYALNMEAKMGDLRHFIKAKDCKGDGRLPKEVSQFKFFTFVDAPSIPGNMDLEGNQ